MKTQLQLWHLVVSLIFAVGVPLVGAVVWVTNVNAQITQIKVDQQTTQEQIKDLAKSIDLAQDRNQVIIDAIRSDMTGIRTELANLNGYLRGKAGK